MRTWDGRYVFPCPFCGVLTEFDGTRRYEQEGFPNVHECTPQLERLRWESQATKQAPAVKPAQGGIDL